MPSFSPELLASDAAGFWVRGRGATVTGFTHDSRSIRPGDCFVALKTDKRDGHDFVATAAAAGATAALVSREVPGVAIPQLVVADTLVALQTLAAAHRRRFAGPVIGVTGSCGKTSTKELLTRLLGEDVTLATEGNYNNHIGVPLTLLRIELERHKYAVVEAGMNAPGEMDRLGEIIDPDCGMVTMVGPAHLEGLGSIERIATEKCALLLRVRRGGLSVYPRDLLQYEDFRVVPGRKIVLGADDCPCVIEDGKEGRELHLGRNREPYLLPPAGPGMESNFALALALSQELGVLPAVLRVRLAGWMPAAKRGQIQRQGARTFYVDCYNANPSSMMESFLTFARRFPGDSPRLYVLAGMREMGERWVFWHEQVAGSLELRPQDKAILVGDEAMAYAAGLRQSGADDAQIHTVADAEAARPLVEAFTGPVLLKGSRYYALETLLNPPGTPAAAH